MSTIEKNAVRSLIDKQEQLKKPSVYCVVMYYNQIKYDDGHTSFDPDSADTCCDFAICRTHSDWEELLESYAVRDPQILWASPKFFAKYVTSAPFDDLWTEFDNLSASYDDLEASEETTTEDPWDELAIAKMRLQRFDALAKKLEPFFESAELL